MEKYELKNHKQPKPPKMTSIEETIQLARLQQALSTSALYERKHNQKALKVLTVAAYILFVSMAAIILSFYYIFIWDPTSKPITPRPGPNCDQFRKDVISEDVAMQWADIELKNSTKISAANFFRNIYERYQRMKSQQEQQRSRRRGRKKMKMNKDANLIVNKLVGHDINNGIDDVYTSLNETDTAKATTITTTSTTTTVTATEQIVQNEGEENAYVDDEDMESDYDAIEASGGDRVKLNETSDNYGYSDGEDNA